MSGFLAVAEGDTVAGGDTRLMRPIVPSNASYRPFLFTEQPDVALVVTCGLLGAVLLTAFREFAKF